MVIVYDAQNPEAIWNRRLVEKYFLTPQRITTIELSSRNTVQPETNGTWQGLANAQWLSLFFPYPGSEKQNKEKGRRGQNITVVTKDD